MKMTPLQSNFDPAITFRFFFFLGDGAAPSASGGLTTASGTDVAAAAASAVTRAGTVLISPRATLACLPNVRSTEGLERLCLPRFVINYELPAQLWFSAPR